MSTARAENPARRPASAPVPDMQHAAAVLASWTFSNEDPKIRRDIGGRQMACNSCENGFQTYQSVVVSIQQSGTTANVFVQNQGRNIVLIRRILLCYTTESGWGMLFLRPPGDPISWIYPSAFLETGITALYYQLNVAKGTVVQAQAEYIEIEGRSRSCAMNF